MSLAGLTGERLLELGGLKTRCSAGLRCVAHGLNLPCALCEVEGEVRGGAVCDACGHRFEQGVPEPEGRACLSSTVFTTSGRIAFEADAVARQHDLNEASRRRDEAERLAAAEAEAQRRREARAAAQREHIERADRERAEAELATRVPRLARALRAVGFALAFGAVAVGAGQLKERLFGGAATASVAVPTKPQAPPAAAPAPSARPLAAAASAVPMPVTPAPGGLVTDGAAVLTADEGGYLRARLERLARSGFTARILLVASTGPEDIAAFGTRVANAWNRAGPQSRSDLLLTVAMSDRRIRVDVADSARARVSDAAASRLIDEHFRPAARSAGVATGLRRLVDQLDRLLSAQRHAVATEAERRTATLTALGAIGDAVAAWDGRLANLPPSATATLESALAELETMQRPERGDRKSARRLHANGLTLVGQPGFEALAAQKLQLAHAADPLDVQVLNDLAYAEMGAGQHRDAAEHLLQTLRLAPTRTSAWVNLAELAPSLVAQAEEAQATAVAMYRVGYWFSGDRPKMLDYLRRRASADDANGTTRAVAAAALRTIEAMAGPAGASETAPAGGIGSSADAAGGAR